MTPRTTENRRQRGGTDATRGRPSRVQRLEQEGDIAADYLEELLDIADLDGDLDMDVEGDRAAVSIVGADLSQLVGQRGEVLEALQELTRLAVYRETGERSRLMLDIVGYRADQREALVKLAEEIGGPGEGVRRAGLPRPDVAVRAQGGPRRGGRGGPATRSPRASSPAASWCPAWLRPVGRLGDVSRETPSLPRRGAEGVRVTGSRSPRGTPRRWPTGVVRG